MYLFEIWWFKSLNSLIYRASVFKIAAYRREGCSGWKQKREAAQNLTASPLSAVISSIRPSGSGWVSGTLISFLLLTLMHGRMEGNDGVERPVIASFQCARRRWGRDVISCQFDSGQASFLPLLIIAMLWFAGDKGLRLKMLQTSRWIASQLLFFSWS